jgi:flagella basal body P-ring formation protein FlgA
MLSILIGAMLQLSAADIGLEQPMAAPKLVRRGQPVTLVVRSGTLTISAQGRALSDGRAGDLVRVVSSSSRTIDGIVEGPGTVRVGGIN